ncbi:sigma-70 family RNA polymerase sigma factor [Vibrio algarum]|uniref:Sigma-70 family RNA polymerase sigma factor n=1 Tax=Vibrio algarum TaxID=3020714 RepID=A0ABT4YW06_9VIBR|nr:sigma-70 family RNA polymerase sigma factor [Vibrio sp. KJ40-1]MDB1125767.1 sigma-70 family RNA polymerase sigma factor [Vibrio sp. KJ40-1]
MKNRTDEQLMTVFGKGDQVAFTELYQRHKGPLYRYFVRQLDPSQGARAEELFQEVWFKVVDKRETYQPSAKFTTWIYKIAHNLVVDEFRKRMSEKAYNTQLDNEPSEELYDPTEQNKSAIKHCMSLLAPLQREAFLLRYESGFEPAQICSIVEAKPEAIKTRLRYALDQLRQCLARKLGGQE